MKNKIFEKNIRALKKKGFNYEELIRNKIEEKRLNKETQIEIISEQSYQGELISVVRCGEKKYYLSGKYSPEGAAKRWAEKIDDISYGTVLYVVGLGDGRVLRYLSQRLEKEVIILLYEPSFEIFWHTLEHYDVSDLLSEKNIIWFIEEINEEELPEVFPKVITIDNITKVRPLIFGNYEQLFPEKVQKAVTDLTRSLSELRVTWNTMMMFSKDTLKNNISNIKYVYNHYSINSLYNILSEDVPAIIVAAGPSLDKNIELLSEVKGKACIIACDTALKPLLKRNIIPDFFVVVDPRKPLELFEEPRTQQIPMISGMNIPIKIMQQHKGKKFFCLDAWFVQELLEYALEDEVKDKPMGCVETGGSVANNAFSIARMMGAKTIILIGQDLAMTGGKDHASGTFKQKQMINPKDYISVPGIDGKEVFTIYNLKLYLEWFERKIEEYKEEILVVDATEGGAFIHGSKVMTLREAVDAYCQKNYNVSEYLENLEKHFTDKQRKRALEFFHDIPKRVEKIQKKIEKGKSYYKQLQKSVQENKYSAIELKKILKKIKKINKDLETDKFVILLMEGIKEEEYVLRASMYEFQDDEQKDLLEGIKMGMFFLEKIEEQLQEIEEEIKVLGEFQGEYEC